MTTFTDMQAHFPFFETGQIYLDSAATTLKPLSVINAMQQFSRYHYANVGRGAHHLTEAATSRYEAVRHKLAALINAGSADQMVFVRGVTEAINLVSQAFLRNRLQPGDEILVSILEHHSNILPWQRLASVTGAKVRFCYLTTDHQLDLQDFAGKLHNRVKLVALTQVSNVLGTVTPLTQLIRLSKQAGIPVLVDGAQAAGHMAVDVQALDCDFYCVSGHKMFGPTGIGALYAKGECWQQMQPWQLGGGMVSVVTEQGFEPLPAPHGFEAGTPNISGVIGFGAAIDFIKKYQTQIQTNEKLLLAYATERLSQIRGVKIWGGGADKAAILSLSFAGVSAYEAAQLLSAQRVCVRSGHLCAMPLLNYLGVHGLLRLSFGCYNSIAELEFTLQTLEAVLKCYQ